MQYLRADTEVIVVIGPFVDVGDGFTPQTDIDISGTNEAELIKHGSGAVTSIAGNTWAAVTDCRGWYQLTITAGQVDTEGQLDVIIQDDSDCLPVHKQFMVVNANVYDSLFAAATTDYLQVDTTQVSGDATAADNLELFTEVLENGTGLIDAGTFKAGAITAAAIADAAIDNATFAADVGSTAYATNIIALAVRKVLDEINLDTLAGVSTGVAADGELEPHVVAGSVLAHIMSAAADATAFKASTDSLEAIKVHADTIKAETVLIVEDTGELQTNQGAWATATGFATPTNITAGTITTATNVTTVNGLAANVITAASMHADAGAEVAAANWAAIMENSVSYAEVMRVVAAVLSGKSSIAAGDMTFVGIDGATDRLVVTESSGARTAVGTWDGSV